jgi:hypothetical protein
MVVVEYVVVTLLGCCGGGLPILSVETYVCWFPPQKGHIIVAGE